MTEFIEKHDYQEILVEDIKQIYKAANDYNCTDNVFGMDYENDVRFFLER